MSTGPETAQPQLQPQLQPASAVASATSEAVGKPEKLVEVTGTLTLLGDSMNHGSATAYSILEIGGQTFTDMRVRSAVNSFLSTGLGSQMTIYVYKKEIVGVKAPDGRLFFTKACFFPKKLFIAGAILLVMPMLGLTLLGVAWLKRAEFRTGQYLESLGGQAV